MGGCDATKALIASGEFDKKLGGAAKAAGGQGGDLAALQARVRLYILLTEAELYILLHAFWAQAWPAWPVVLTIAGTRTGPSCVRVAASMPSTLCSLLLCTLCNPNPRISEFETPSFLCVQAQIHAIAALARKAFDDVEDHVSPCMHRFAHAFQLGPAWRASA